MRSHPALSSSTADFTKTVRPSSRNARCRPACVYPRPSTCSSETTRAPTICAISSCIPRHDAVPSVKGGAMIDHVTANVGDFEQAKRFYAQALAPLGYSLQMEFEGAAGFGTGEGIPDFWIGSSEERGATHVAFSAADRAAVDAFYEAATAAGGKDNGAPGVRAHYHESYYAAYVHDADGNNIEAVCHKPE